MIMKKVFIRTSLILGLGLVLFSCSKKEASSAEHSETLMSEDSEKISEDKEILSNDSATVETAVGVKDEEANAKVDEAKADEKLKNDEKTAESKVK